MCVKLGHQKGNETKTTQNDQGRVGSLSRSPLTMSYTLQKLLRARLTHMHTHKTKPEWKRMISRDLRPWEAAEEAAAASQEAENDRVRL